MNKDVKKYFPYFQIFSSTYSVIIYTLLTFVCSAHATFFFFLSKACNGIWSKFQEITSKSSFITSDLTATNYPFFLCKVFPLFQDNHPVLHVIERRPIDEQYVSSPSSLSTISTTARSLVSQTFLGSEHYCETNTRAGLVTHSYCYPLYNLFTLGYTLLCLAKFFI